MSNAADLGSIMREVIQNGREVDLKPEQISSFYSCYQADVSNKIEAIRSEQRRAYEEGKNLILS